MNIKFTLSFVMIIFFSVKLFAQLEGAAYDHPESAPLITEEVTSIMVHVYDSRVFKFVPGESGLYTIRTNSMSDTYGRLFNGTDFADINIIAEGDDEDGLNFVINYAVTAGTTYYVMIYDYTVDNVCDLTISGGTLPVELTTFTATNLNNGISLNWSTATEINNYGFEVERASLGTTPGQVSSSQETVSNKQKTTGSVWEKVGFIKGSGNSNSPKEYSFIDNNPNSGVLKYRLKQIDADGKFKYYSQTAEILYNYTDVKETQIPQAFTLSQNYPNPFNPATFINYQLPEPGYIELKVFNMLGVEVAALVNEEQSAGSYKVEFNAGKYNLSSGIYLYRLKTKQFTSTKKLILLK